MRVVVVCTGNVARSPALAILTSRMCPEHEIESAAVGRKAVAGLRMRKPMRELMTAAGYGTAAEAHRSQLLADVQGGYDMILAVAPVHMQRLKELGSDVPRMQCVPPIADPVWGGAGAYEKAWQQIQDMAGRLASFLG